MDIFLPQSGNLGDTCNILPVLSGVYKSTGEKVNLVVRDKMKNFKGFKKLMESQEFISSLRYESEVDINEKIFVYLTNNITRTSSRPWETERYAQTFRDAGVLFKVDDDFILNVPEMKTPDTKGKYVVGDRTYTKDADTRREFNILRSSSKFPEEKCVYLDYTKSLIYNLNLIKKSSWPFITTFTGIAVLADLMLKETMVFYGEQLSFWDNKPIIYSYNQHFYVDRRCELIHLEEF